MRCKYSRYKFMNEFWRRCVATMKTTTRVLMKSLWKYPKHSQKDIRFILQSYAIYKTKQMLTPLRDKCTARASVTPAIPKTPSAVCFNSSRKTWDPIIHCIGFHLLPLIKVNVHCLSHTVHPLLFSSRSVKAGPVEIPHWEFVAITKPACGEMRPNMMKIFPFLNLIECLSVPRIM